MIIVAIFQHLFCGVQIFVYVYIYRYTYNIRLNLRGVRFRWHQTRSNRDEFYPESIALCRSLAECLVIIIINTYLLSAYEFWRALLTLLIGYFDATRRNTYHLKMAHISPPSYCKICLIIIKQREKNLLQASEGKQNGNTTNVVWLC